MSISQIKATTALHDTQNAKSDQQHSVAVDAQAKRNLIRRLNAERIEKSNALREAALSSYSVSNEVDITGIAGLIRQKKANLQSSSFQLRPNAFRLASARAKQLYSNLIDSEELNFNTELSGAIEALGAAQGKKDGSNSDSEENQALKEYLLLSYLNGQRNVTSSTKDAIVKKIDDLDKKFGGVIFSQINADTSLENAQGQAFLAAASANASSIEEQKNKRKKTRKEFVETYKNIVLGIDGLSELFVYLSKRFSFEVLREGVNQIKVALGHDLKSSRSSMSPDKLGALLADMRNLSCISLMLDHMERNKSRFSTLKMTGLPKDSDYFTACVNITTGAHMLEALVKLAVRVRPTYVQGVTFVQETGQVLRELPGIIWADPKTQGEVLQAIAQLAEKTSKTKRFS